MSFLKNIWRTSSKHKKLSEEWALAKNNKDIENELTEAESTEEIAAENENEKENTSETTFQLKFIGSTLVECATNETTTAEAIKTILRVAKASKRKLPKVKVNVSHRGIQISDEQSGKLNEISIYRISYCSADASHSRVFAFIAANNNETMECHAFLCRKRKQAQTVTLAVARSFSMAYEAWRTLPPSSKQKESEQIDQQQHFSQLIDLSDFNDDSNQNLFNQTVDAKLYNQDQWVSFDDENESQRWSNRQQIDLICQ